MACVARPAVAAPIQLLLCDRNTFGRIKGPGVSVSRQRRGFAMSKTVKQICKVAQCEHKDVIDQLVGEFQHSGWDLAAPDKAGRTTLHYAAYTSDDGWLSELALRSPVVEDAFADIGKAIRVKEEPKFSLAGGACSPGLLLQL